MAKAGGVVNIHEAPRTKAEVRENPDGPIDVFMRQIESQMAKKVAGNGLLGRTISDTFGLKRRARGE